MADGTGSEERLLERGDLIDLMANGWSADGTHLLFTEVSSAAKVVATIGQIAFERPTDVQLLLNNGSNNARRPFHQTETGWPTTPTCPVRPRFMSSGIRSLGIEYRSRRAAVVLPYGRRTAGNCSFSTPDGRQMFAVPVQSGTTFVAGRPKVLFDFTMIPNAAGNRPFDIAPDGRFFIIRDDPDAGVFAAPNLIFVQNWFEELKRLVPRN